MLVEDASDSQTPW